MKIKIAKGERNKIEKGERKIKEIENEKIDKENGGRREIKRERERQGKYR